MVHLQQQGPKDLAAQAENKGLALNIISIRDNPLFKRRCKMKLSDFNTASKAIELQDIQTQGIFGKSIVKYRLVKHDQVENLDAGSGYILMMTQRIIIPNPNPPPIGASSLKSFSDYPAIITNDVKITPPARAVATLLGMFPKTLNSCVSTTTSAEKGTNASNSTMNTSGSSSTNVNTFGVSVGGGFFGDMPTGTLTAEYSHSWEKTHSRSSSVGHDSSANQAFTDMDSMSIKDWSSYGYVPDELNPCWMWGQSYPWDVVQYNQDDGKGGIILPMFVQDRMRSVYGSDKFMVMPPSQLSLLGLDFTMKAAWLIEFNDDPVMDESIAITSTVASLSATHLVKSDGTVFATLQSMSDAKTCTISSPKLDLSEYALAPIIFSENTHAAVSLSSGKFLVAPSDPSKEFKARSEDNNLLITGKGFGGDMIAKFSSPVSFNLTFKIADTENEYALALLHARGQESPDCILTITINGNELQDVMVQDEKSKSPNNNLSVLSLRNLNISDMNFHDYLKVGTNVIEIAVSHSKPEGGQKPSYELIAAHIEALV
jgi:hypothetical protein